MVEIVTVTETNVEAKGLFCVTRSHNPSGWQAKREWLSARFAEGLQMRLLGGGERGFIEFMPGAKSWRAIDGAEDFVVIHCLWVVGASRGQGHARALLQNAEAWARDQGYRGIAALTSHGSWLIAPGILEHLGYSEVEKAEGGFELTAKTFRGGPLPRLSGGWRAKAEACGPGLCVLRSAQCPHLENAADHARRAAEKRGVRFNDVLIESADEVRARAPTPYGTFALVYNGKLISSHFMPEDRILPLLG